jgi:hypothetical protein
MLLASIFDKQIWFLLPLLVTVSLVYGATRHELMQPILHHAYRSGVWMVSFMLTVFLILWALAWLVG